eukprot:403341839
MKRNCQSIITRLKTKVDYSALIKKGAVWKDPSFSYSDDAFYFPKYTNQGQPFQNPSTYQIDRPKNRNAKLSLFGNQKQPGPLDIRQGQLGDCYFLASCSAITEYQQRVMNAFVTQEFNSAGVIVVRGYILGQPTDIVVDDTLAFSTSATSKGELLYDMAPSSNGLWAAYLEKVWAKVMGNFEVIEGGWSEEVMQFLTGAPTLTYVKDYNGFTSADDVWNVISNSDNARYIIMAGTPGQGNDQDILSNGLAKSHAYTLLEAYILKEQNGTIKARLFKMRNPWGKDGKYKGQYNDNDPIWTQGNYASQVGFQKADDGLFFITAEEFYDSFDAYSIAFYSDSYQISANTVYGDNGKGYKFDFSLPSDAEGYMGIDYYSSRMYPPGCKTKNTMGQMIISYNGSMILNSRMDTQDDDYYSFLKAKWRAGKYTVFYRTTQWDKNDVKDFGFRTYFPWKLNISMAPYDCSKIFT